MKKLISCIVMMAVCGMTAAHDFAVTLNGQKLYFNITSKKNKTVELTYNGSAVNLASSSFEGELDVPAKVKHDDVVYSVTAVGPKAFSGAEKMTGVILPLGVSRIGDFAFEGCSSLSKIIFPGNNVKFGQGVFFKCDKIEVVSFGSDWKEVDLKIFRWSDSLATLTIPAKMEKIQNMKSLKSLQSISVDANNGRFMAIDGVLYNKSGETLYGCPRAYKGALRIADGTKKITRGALADCLGLTRIDIPASVVALSFKELSRLNLLNEIIFRGELPMKTAKLGSKEVFLLQVANPEVNIIVPKKAKDVYKEALVQQEGEYAEIDGIIPYLIKPDVMPKAKNILGVKNFLKYE